VTLARMLGPQIDTWHERAWPKFMTARVAAEYSHSSPWTIRRHVQPCGRRGRSFVYSLESVDAWMRGEPVARRNEASQAIPAVRASVPNAASLTRIRDLAKPERRHAAVEPDKDHVAA
jgi:hypothetical protein